MLKIQVLGTGMIPRLGVIAPRIEPFMADLTWISLILSTPGLEINYIDPTDYSVHHLIGRSSVKSTRSSKTSIMIIHERLWIQ